jgi:hypothetical protein
MAAGLGFKDFTTGEVLTAADVDGYLMQGVWVFADATARTSAVTSPEEGNMSFLKDTNSLEYYDGAAWAAVAGGGGATFVGCSLYKTGNQSIAHDTTTALTFDAESFDTDAFHDNSTNTSRITIPAGKGGKYYFGGLISAESGNNGRSLTTRVNNTNTQQVYYEQASQSGNVYFSWNLMRNLSEEDYFEVFYDQGGGVSKNVYGGSANDTSLYCVYLGE